MLFNSIDFAIFLPIVFLLYWIVRYRSVKLQNSLIVLASYVFYGWWDWRFLSLIIFSTIVDYFVSIQMQTEENNKKRRSLLWLSLIINLGFLGVFKYYNFFLDNFSSVFSFFGSEINGRSLKIVVPVGISFYTFQTLSYTVDVYRKKLTATKDFISFSAFVCFFPQLVAGPIERATSLLPQFYKKRKFEYEKAVDGLRQILWGLFKKIVIADNCAEYANLIFNNSDSYSGSTLVLGAFFFTFQIYGDFSGYSDIAIGTSRLFGFNLNRNFNFPYFSRNIAEFWRRWHISLSTWFRDYLYIPLGGSKGSIGKKVRNVFIIFIVSGFWHGANWTFIVWGALNAFYFLPLMLTNNNRLNTDSTIAKGRFFPSVKEAFLMLMTFSLTVLAWVFFRAENVGHALRFIASIFSKNLFSVPSFNDLEGHPIFPKTILLVVMIFLLVEWIGRESQFAIQHIAVRFNVFARYIFYYAIISAIYWLGAEEQQFIYFQF